MVINNATIIENSTDKIVANKSEEDIILVAFDRQIFGERFDFPIPVGDIV